MLSRVVLGVELEILIALLLIKLYTTVTWDILDYLFALLILSAWRLQQLYQSMSSRSLFNSSR
jgi:hypothetical protein